VKKKNPHKRREKNITQKKNNRETIWCMPAPQVSAKQKKSRPWGLQGGGEGRETTKSSHVKATISSDPVECLKKKIRGIELGENSHMHGSMTQGNSRAET